MSQMNDSGGAAPSVTPPINEPGLPTGATVRPATDADVHAVANAFPDMQPDRWRGGDNRRSFAALADGHVVGHCRGIDNVFHPGTRTLVFEIDDAHRGTDLEDQLLAAQIAVSTVPLTVKLTRDTPAMTALSARHRGFAYQLCPPWAYVVGPEMRAWAARHIAAHRAPTAGDSQALAQLEAEHYAAQHAAWNPSAPIDTMLDAFADDHDPDAPGYDRDRSVVIERDGRVVAAALVWPGSNAVPDLDLTGEAEEGGREVTLLSNPYDSPAAWRDKAACIAAVVERSADGDRLLIDSHATQRGEIALMGNVPGLDPAHDDEWTALVAIPAGTGANAQVRPLPADALPADLSAAGLTWARPLLT